ncbi:MAG: glycosyltransferase family 9 protein [Acidobacteriia bacterium]|nr:glycosyltransferase family 9 protein [Terriglobia bacterium]
MKILILHPGALGDVILSLPTLQVLRERFQHARITLAANIDFAGAVATGYADQIISLSALPLHRLHGSESIPLEDVMLWRSYDRIISWTGSGAEGFTKQFAQLHPCVLVASWRPAAGEEAHVASLFMDSLRPWFSPPREIVPPGIRLEATARVQGEEWLREQGWQGRKPVLALHPGAGSAAKRWPLQRFQGLAQWLGTLGDPLVVEGPAETGIGRELAGACNPGTYLASSLPLPLLAGVLSHCRLYVGNDSGIAHLAAGLQTACVVLFGPTSSGNWAPIGKQVVVVRNTRGCIACEEEPGAAHTCMGNIPLETVQERVFRVLQSRV